MHCFQRVCPTEVEAAQNWDEKAMTAGIFFPELICFSLVTSNVVVF